MAQEANVVRRGVYNVEYFSGAQVSLYIGDVWVDEVTTLSYGYMQNRRPIYGYASTLYDDLSEGQVLVQGTFTINFKEAGYLWLILNRFKEKFFGGQPLFKQGKNPFVNSASTNKNTIERLVNSELTVFERNRQLQQLSEEMTKMQEVDRKAGRANENPELFFNRLSQRGLLGESANTTAASLGGFASNTRSSGGIGRAENLYEEFEDAVWGKAKRLTTFENRRPDDPRLNPFEIYVAFGDFAGDNRANHTIERIKDVSILGKSKQIVIDGMPIQEQYTFIARELV